MPGLARKVLIVAAVEGLLLFPAGPNSKPPPGRPWKGTKIAWKTGVVTPYSYTPPEGRPQGEEIAGISAEIFGIVGHLKVNSRSWLVTITDREQVASQCGRYPVFRVNDVAIIPLQSRSEGELAVSNVKHGKSKSRGSMTPANDTDDEDIAAAAAISSGEVSDDENVPPRPAAPERRSSVAEDVIGKKGVYGRFANNWFFKRGWQTDGRRSQGMSSVDDAQPIATAPATISGTETEAKGLEGDAPTQPASGGDQMGTQEGSEEVITESKAISLTPKLLRSARTIFAESKSLYFCHEYDITRPLAGQSSQGSSLPLHKQVDTEFFWNKHLLTPFLDGNHDQFALPLMQGFVGQSHFQIPSPSPEGTPRNFLLTVTSRRSIKRPGLRYLRRGVDMDGNVANCVETEQLLTDLDNKNNYSFVQIRGSIPVFFTQSPYVLKPKPEIQQTEEVTKRAFQQHFNKLHGRYGKVQSISLVERGSQEAIVGNLFERYAHEMDEPKTDFEWFDFHRECRGMKFENVSRLMDRIGNVMNGQGWTEDDENGVITKKQAGILRTNCMDCLDRTNVVQSACGRYVLDKQLEKLGFDPTTLDETLRFFNLIWADNGDAVSKQYSSTAALKGDFTRTRKRNIRGALSDFGLTLTRFWNNIIGDYFTQAVIDFLLGNVNEQVFVEFEEKMMSGDPSVSLRKLRLAAIETSAKIVIEDVSEEILGAWTLSVPQEDNSLRTPPFKDAVLLLTDAALYFCRFDFQMDKVSSFTRIDLLNIKKIQHGSYITSTLTTSNTDPNLNYGFVVRFSLGRDTNQRVNTRTLTSAVSLSSRPSTAASINDDIMSKPSDVNAAAATVTGEGRSHSPAEHEELFLAFKALQVDSAIPTDADGKEESGTGVDTDVPSTVVKICKQIEAACLKGDKLSGGEVKNILEEKEIISLAEAKKSTGFFEQVGYSIRRLVWG